MFNVPVLVVPERLARLKRNLWRLLIFYNTVFVADEWHRLQLMLVF